MYEEFFEMQNTPFSRDVPADRLYTSPVIDDAIGRLTYAADRQLFAVHQPCIRHTATGAMIMDILRRTAGILIRHSAQSVR